MMNWNDEKTKAKVDQVVEVPDEIGRGTAWLALLMAGCLVAVMLAMCGASPVHAGVEGEPAQVCGLLPNGEWDTWVLPTVQDALDYVRDNPPSYLMWPVGAPGRPCPPVDEPTPTATATPAPTATPTPTPTPAPACPGASVQARVSITGMVTLANSTGTAVGPFGLTITTTSAAGVVVLRWADVTALARSTTIVGQAWPGRPSHSMGRWGSVAQMGGAWCEAVPAGDGWRYWFPFMAR
jgi:hypothetical protein